MKLEYVKYDTKFIYYWDKSLWFVRDDTMSNNLIWGVFAIIPILDKQHSSEMQNINRSGA